MQIIHLKGEPVAEAYRDVVARFLGEPVPLRFASAERRSFMQRLLGGR